MRQQCIRQGAALWRRPLRQMGTVVPQAAGSSSSDAAAAIGVMLRERDIALKTPLDDVAVAQLPSRLRFLESLGVDDLGKAARLCPELLHSEPAAIAPRLEYLLGLGVSDIATAVKHAPALLSCDMTRDFHLKVAILASLGVTDIAHFVTSNPRIVNLDVDKDMRPAVELLRSIEGLEVGRVLNRIPTVAFNAPYLRKRIDFLTELGVRKLGHVLTRHPNLLAYAVEGNMQRKVEWFRERGFSDVPGLITNNPSLLSMPIEARLLPTLELLLGPLGRTINEIERFPRIFNYSIETLSLRHDFLTDVGKTGRHGLTRTYRASPFTFSTKLAGRSIHEWESFLRQRARHRAGSPRAADIFFARQAAATAKDEARQAAVQTERERVAKLLEQHAKAGAMEPAQAVEAVSRMLKPRATPEPKPPAPATVGGGAGAEPVSMAHAEGEESMAGQEDAPPGN